MSDGSASIPARTRSEVRGSLGPGWIWALPIAAALLVGGWVARELLSGGENITIQFDDVHGLKRRDSKILYRGLEVGQVTDIELAKDGSSVIVTAEIQGDAQHYLRSGTQFWLRGAVPDFSDPASLGAILSGPKLVMEPGPGDKATKFVGLIRKPVVTGAHDDAQVYAIALPGAVGGLSPGAPVKLHGFTVGAIKTIGFHYDARADEIGTPVTIALYPSLFHIEGADSAQRAAALKMEVAALIRRGLKARLERAPPLIGSPEVTLVMTSSEAAPSTASEGGLPEIPAASDSGPESIIQRVNQLPVDRIADNVLSITQHIDAVVGSPALKDAIDQLDGALAQIHSTVHEAGPRIDDVVDRLRKAAGQIEKAAAAAEETAKSAQQTARQADKVLGGVPTQNGVPETMREIESAARSVRELANYLDRHPEALLEGRGGK